MSHFPKNDLRHKLLQGIEYTLSLLEEEVTVTELMVAMHKVLSYLIDGGHANYSTLVQESSQELARNDEDLLGE